MTSHTTDPSLEPTCEAAVWSQTVAKYKRPHLLTSLWQVANTFVPFGCLCYLMYLSLSWSYALTLALAVPTAALLVRVFIIQHDCGHHSFFRSHRANDILGYVCGVITLTPYHFWRRTHARHHTTSGNLSHRGHGDVLTLTVDEYLCRTPHERLAYRLYRNPFVMFFLAASFLFIIRQRFAIGMPRSWRRERNSVHATNLGILALFVLAHFTIGATTLYVLWLPVAVLAAAAGSWLFFVQHQYEDAYWQPQQSWDFNRAALEGSSYYRLPPVLQWFTGNIGFHHIHHLNSRIPNYHLPACYDAEPAFRDCPTIGLWDSLKCASLKLWDEERQRMVGFGDIAEKRVADVATERVADVAKKRAA